MPLALVNGKIECIICEGGFIHSMCKMVTCGKPLANVGMNPSSIFPREMKHDAITNRKYPTSSSLGDACHVYSSPVIPFTLDHSTTFHRTIDGRRRWNSGIKW